MSPEQRVRLRTEGHVAHVELNRPDKRNAVDLAMFRAIVDCAERLAGDGDVRAVVVSGAGGSFCAGIDTALFTGSAPRDLAALMAPRAPSPANLFQQVSWLWRELPVPVIVAVEGVAYGAGMQIALGADIRYAAPDARLSIMEIEWGLIPDMGLTAVARSLVRRDVLRELVWTGRVVAADEARELGLVTSVHDDPLGRAFEVARAVAARSPDAIRQGKRLLNEAFEVAPPDALAVEARLQAELIGTPNQVEAIRAKAEGREPRFDD